MNDEKLDRLLQQHRPTAPRAPRNELEQIKAQTSQEASRGLWWKIGAPALIAASLLLVFLIPNRNPDPTISSEQEQLEQYLDDTLGAFYAGNGDLEMSIGDEWRELLDY